MLVPRPPVPGRSRSNRRCLTRERERERCTRSRPMEFREQGSRAHERRSALVPTRSFGILDATDLVLAVALRLQMDVLRERVVCPGEVDGLGPPPLVLGLLLLLGA